MVRVLAVLAALTLPACWPGHCGGAIRGVNPEPGEPFAATSYWWLNVDTGEKSGPALLAASKITAENVLLAGPQGRISVDLDARIATSAHSCASAGSIEIKPRAPLVPGDYTLVILLDQIAFPAIDDDDVGTWQGHRAIVRRYQVR